MGRKSNLSKWVVTLEIEYSRGAGWLLGAPEPSGSWVIPALLEASVPTVEAWAGWSTAATVAKKRLYDNTVQMYKR